MGERTNRTRIVLRDGVMVAPEVVVAEEIVAKTTTQQGLGQEITDTKALEDIADVVWPADES